MLHILTTEQLCTLIEAYGDGKSPPKHTDDPRVNHAIDCIVQDEDEPYDEELNVAEIKAAKDAGLD